MSSKCPPGKIRRKSYIKFSHSRKSYRRKDGKRVKSARVKPAIVKSACIKDRGMKGKGPALIPKLEKGVLSHFNYHLHLSERERHLALLRALEKHDIVYLIRRLVVLAILFKNTIPENAKRARKDYLWLMELKNKARRSRSSRRSRSPRRSRSRSRSHSPAPRRRRSLSKNRSRSPRRSRSRSRR